MICSSLRILKCPIQNITTTIAQQLLNRNLEELFLVNDEHTLNLNFTEKTSIKWTMLRVRPDCQFKVKSLVGPNTLVQPLMLDSHSWCVSIEDAASHL